MKKFWQYFNEQVTVGVTEYIEIDGIGRLKAKIDSGNEGYNVLHGVNISDIGDSKIKFQTIDNKTVSFVKRGEISIHAGKANEMRPVINLSIKLGDQFYEDVPFSITDRSANDEPVLIGEPFLKKINALIDVNKAHLQESGKHKMEHGPLSSRACITEREHYERLLNRRNELIKQLQAIATDEYTVEMGILQSKIQNIEEVLRKMKKPASQEFAKQAFSEIRQNLSK